MKRIVITGASGMIGASLANAAVNCGIEVLCIVRKDSPRLGNLPTSPLVETISVDLCEYSKLTYTGRFDAFFHLAWDKTYGLSRDDVDSQLLNVQYTLDAVRLANRFGCSSFIGAGSQAEYGLVSEPLRGNTPVNPQSGYGVAKYAAGKLSRLLCNRLGIRHNWARILSVYGPLDASHTLIMYVINELRNGRSPELTKCEQIWDYLYCDDAAEALLAIAKNGKDGVTYPLGSGTARKLSSYLEEIASQVNPVLELGFGKKEYYPHQPMFLQANIDDLKSDTKWAPKVSFPEGVRKILDSLS